MPKVSQAWADDEAWRVHEINRIRHARDEEARRKAQEHAKANTPERKRLDAMVKRILRDRPRQRAYQRKWRREHPEQAKARWDFYNAKYKNQRDKYYANRRRNDPEWRELQNQRSMQYAAANLERIRAYRRNHRLNLTDADRKAERARFRLRYQTDEAFRTKQQEHARQYWRSHPEKSREASRNYALAHPEKHREASRTWAASHREEILAKKRAARANLSEERREKERANSCAYYARKRAEKLAAQQKAQGEE